MTILRESEHQALAGFPLSGKVIDLGGDTRSQYSKLFKGTFTIETVNMDPKTKPDFMADLEQPLPVPSGAYDAVLLINVLEHIFEYRQLLGEGARILAPGGKVIIIVPYMFPYHPSPGDFHRYSKDALERALTLAGFDDIDIRALGTGVFATRLLFIERLLPGSIQSVLGLVLHPLARIFDTFFSGTARLLKKKYDPADYALGYFVTASKNS